MTQTTKPTVESLLERIEQLEEALKKKRGTASTREMTDEDARRILNGNLREVSHKKAAETLGLSYGQIYSCRLEYTFKHIHKELSKAEGYKSLWHKQ
jgi:hypothetical protein